ncbi:hypothetical protein CLU79DRAFT_222829 [Phycomyces nitens]|nr:hypothetical protein CLU79DRAFT_222829 [Phycomyces nitens]
MPASTATANAPTSLSKSHYTAIPSFPACLGGEWKNLVKKPYLKATMRFTMGTVLPPHHFPSVSRIEVISGSIQVNDLQSGEAYLIGPGQDCMVPALLVHEVQCIEDVEFEFAMNRDDMVIYWDLEER